MSAGKVSFEGRDLTSQSPQTVYRAGISRTFQRSRLWLPLAPLLPADDRALAWRLFDLLHAGLEPLTRGRKFPSEGLVELTIEFDQFIGSHRIHTLIISACPPLSGNNTGANTRLPRPKNWRWRAWYWRK